MNIKSAYDSFGKMLTIGTVLYRDVSFRRSPKKSSVYDQPIEVVEPISVPFALGDRGNKMFRINLIGRFGWSPNVFIPEGSERGIVCFVNDYIPENWTHLIVTGNSFKLVEERENSALFNGAIFASCPTPYSMDAYLEYRTRMGNDYSQVVTQSKLRNLPWLEKMKIIRKLCAPENRIAERHLFCEMMNRDMWCYDHITWKPETNTTSSQTNLQIAHAK